MESHAIYYHLLNLFNSIVVLYFVFGNGTYTLLMMMSFVQVWLHNRKLQYAGLNEVRESAVTPPISLIVPAYNEEKIIVDTVHSLMQLDYPGKEILVVDDGSTDNTLLVLIQAFGLQRMDFIYRSRIPTKPLLAFYFNPKIPELTVLSKVNGGKPDALNAGINMARSPYFCTVDSDCIIERDALLRLIQPVLRSKVNVVACGGIVRILNGCKVEEGRVTRVELPDNPLIRFQIVEYLRGFLFGRTGWDLIRGTFIVSGAFCIFHRETVSDMGGFSNDTVTEDIDLIACLHRFLRAKKWVYRMAFISDPVCWTEAPSDLPNLGRQRRRWQLGLGQTLAKHHEIMFNPRYGVVGMITFPFYVFMEFLGALVEFGGYLIIPLGFLLGVTPLALFTLFIFLGVVYGSFLSAGSVLLEEITYRRYPSLRNLLQLLGYACLENIGYRQLVLFYRVQAVILFLLGSKRWEAVKHYGIEKKQHPAMATP